MTGYTRQDVGNNIANGNVADAGVLDSEFDAIVAAFHSSTGHAHDGTAASGPPITKLGPAQEVTISGSGMFPKADNTYDLGSALLSWKGLWLDGTATVAALTTSAATITGGTITGITDLAVADGGTGASTASAARTNLGLGTMALETATNYPKLATSNTFTANQTISNAVPSLLIDDTDASVGGSSSSRVEFNATGAQNGLVGFNSAIDMSVVANKSDVIISSDANNLTASSGVQFKVDGTLAGRIEPAGTSLPNTTSVVTQEKGDARYARLGATNLFTTNYSLENTAPVFTINDSDASVGLSSVARVDFNASGFQQGLVGFSGGSVLNLYAAQGNVTIAADAANAAASSVITLQIDGATAGRVEPAGTSSPNATSVITREKGDARYYIQDSSYTLANTSPTITLNDTDASVGGVNNHAINFNSSGSLSASIGHRGGSNFQYMTQAADIVIAADAGNTQASSAIFMQLDGGTVAQINAGGTTSSSITTVITREKGDARFAPISDQTLKNNITPMGDVLGLIKNINPVNYEWKNPEGLRPKGARFGVIAQNIRDVAPEALITFEDGTLGVDTLGLIGMLVKAVQELSEKVKTLEANAV